MLCDCRYWAAAALTLLTVFASCQREIKPSVLATATSEDHEAQLCNRIDKALAFTAEKRHMDVHTNAAWQIVHGVLVYGRDLQIYDDGKLVNALDYLLAGGTCTGWTLRPGDHGVVAVLEAGSKTGQGHPDQWLGYFSQCGLPLDRPLTVAGHDYTVGDMLEQAKWDVHKGMEATWTLMAFANYLPFDTNWTARDGTEWNIERIVDMEASADVDSAACGGSHRLYGLAVTLNRYLAQGGKLEGAWLKADERIKQAIQKARENQQPDGTFSTNYFQRPATSDDIALRLNTTGHTFEFLTVALDDRQFNEPWMNRAFKALLDMVERTEDFDLECGGLYHAMHGLQLYRLRRFGPAGDGEAPAADRKPAISSAAAPN